MSNTNSDIVCAVHFSNKPSSSCHSFITDAADYGGDFNDEYEISGAYTSGLASGSIFSNNKNILQICKDFSGLKKTYHFCRGCESLERFHSGSSKPSDFDFTNKITGSFDNCISAQYMFGQNNKVTEVDLSFPVCTDFQGNYQYSKNLTKVTIDCPNAINMVGEFVGCTKLGYTNLDPVTFKSVTFKSGLKHLVCGKQMFEGCEMLSEFDYHLNSLLSGINMFTGCQLDIDSIKTILEKLPDVTNGNGVKLNDYSLTDDEVNEDLQLIDTDNIWTNGLYANDDESVTENTIMKKLHRNKSKSSFVYYIYSEDNEGQTKWVENTIHFGEFGVINFGVDKDTETTLDERSKHDYINESIKSAIDKGWRITYNDKTIK